MELFFFFLCVKRGAGGGGGRGIAVIWELRFCYHIYIYI